MSPWHQSRIHYVSGQTQGYGSSRLTGSALHFSLFIYLFSFALWSCVKADQDDGYYFVLVCTSLDDERNN